MKVVLVIVGILLAAAGGVIAYRALYLEPAAAVVITNTDVREVPNTIVWLVALRFWWAVQLWPSSRRDINANRIRL